MQVLIKNNEAEILSLFDLNRRIKCIQESKATFSFLPTKTYSGALNSIENCCITFLGEGYLRASVKEDEWRYGGGGITKYHVCDSNV